MRSGLAVGVALALLAACGNASNGNTAGPTTPRSAGTTVRNDDFTKHVPVDAPGVSDTEIHVGAVTSKTNPVNGDYGLFADGIEAYFDVVNSDGGIYGRRLKLTSNRDDQTASNTAQTQALVSQDNVYAAFVATVLFTGAPLLKEAGIPTFGWNLGAEWAGPENFFPNVAPLCLDGCPLLPHVAPWLVGQSHAHRVAVIGYSVPQSSGCVNGNVDDLARFGTNVDAQVVFHDATLSFGEANFSAQVMKMKQKHVDFLITCMDFNGDYAIAKEMNKQLINDAVTVYHPNLYNRPFVKANGKLLEGDIALAQVTAVEHQPPAPGVAEYLRYADSHDLTVSEATMQGWISARQLVDALKAAGPDFTWQNLIGAWNQQTWYTAGGWITPIDWTKQHHDPAGGMQYRSQFECANFVRVHDSDLVPVYDDGGAKPWVCFDGHKPDVWQDPVNLSFAGKPFAFADVAPKAQG